MSEEGDDDVVGVDDDDDLPSDYPETLREFTPSTQLVFFVIREYGPLPLPTLQRYTSLSKWTVSKSTITLEKEGLIERYPAQSNPRVVVCDIIE